MLITSKAGAVLDVANVWDLDDENLALMIAAPELLAVALMAIETATSETPRALIDAARAAVRAAAPELLQAAPR